MDQTLSNQKITWWEFGNFAAAAMLGTLLHFLYDLTNQSVLTAPFSAVNESTFEHMKILFFPLFIYSLIQSRFFRDIKNYWCIKLYGILTGLFLIPVLFYTYNGAIGKSPDFVNIGIFFVAAAAVSLLESYLMKRRLGSADETLKKESVLCRYPILPFLLICFLAILFILFTFAPPEIPLFKDPLSGTYGI